MMNYLRSKFRRFKKFLFHFETYVEAKHPDEPAEAKIKGVFFNTIKVVALKEKIALVDYVVTDEDIARYASISTDLKVRYHFDLWKIREERSEENK